MKHLILLSHGSRLAGTHEHFESIALQCTSLLGEQYKAIHSAYLELAEPSLLDAVANACAQGAMQIDVFPLFLAPGKHVNQDIPQQLAEAEKLHAQCTFQQLPFLGSHPKFAAFIAQCTSQNVK